MQLKEISTSFYGHLGTSHNWGCMRVLVDCVPLHNRRTIDLLGENVYKLIHWSMFLGFVVASYAQIFCCFHSCNSMILQKLIWSEHCRSHSYSPIRQHESFEYHILLHHCDRYYMYIACPWSLQVYHVGHPMALLQLVYLLVVVPSPHFCVLDWLELTNSTTDNTFCKDCTAEKLWFTAIRATWKISEGYCYWNCMNWILYTCVYLLCNGYLYTASFNTVWDSAIDLMHTVNIVTIRAMPPMQYVECMYPYLLCTVAMYAVSYTSTKHS